MNNEEITLCDVLYAVNQLRDDLANLFPDMTTRKQLEGRIASLEIEKDWLTTQKNYLIGLNQEYKERLEEYEPPHINVIGEGYDVNDCND